MNLTTRRCDPIPGYYDNNLTIAAPCSVGCTSCTSATSCQACSSNYQLSGGFCFGPCPVRTYANTSNSANSTCKRCPFDCYTCISNGDCLSCDSADFRYLSGVRCIPNSGYYESGQQMAGKCSSGCLSCTSLSNCSGCSSGYSL